MKIVVLGGGPGGYVAAIRAAQLGADVTLIERKALGGTCLNVGCIPTKVLLHTSELYAQLKQDGQELGLEAADISFNWPQLQKRKDKIIKLNAGGIDALLKKNKIAKVMGSGTFIGEHELKVTAADGSRQTVNFDYAIIASGSEPARVPIPGADLDGVISSDEALALPEVPESLCIIGGGVIGCEFASVYSSLGCRVTIVEMLPELITTMDQDTVGCLMKQFAKEGIQILTSTQVERIERTESGLKVSTTSSGVSRMIEADKVLIATGRRPVTDGLGLECIGVNADRHGIKVNSRMQTSASHIYAIGDCTGGIMLAHVASAEGMIAAEAILAESSSDIDFRTIPSCVYTRPELASVGMTERLAREKGFEVRTGVFPLQVNAKSMIMGETNGLVKFVVDARTDEILGLHIAGPRATDLIAEGALAIRLEATLDEIATTIHAHPTVAESLLEAAHAAHHRAIHLHG
ncbi:dihydrolipoamide dehydrogenase [Fontibacillus panacisegetis]|uniref:Dihydrolipoyl dehydrogenase n=1 Tax=Fontibacillus panacisegetis TaxID=670482 RepID=A0A1G7N6P8_9BACL|nr:dihydrolipoyl dehydrogenase [Fontibacillus panacisegetis]SDF69735.1 dihydrolipoamide dehydrogenase [Fontibacillus panacisegetis]